MQRYTRAIDRITASGQYSMKVFGNSMLPLIKSGSVLVFHQQDSYEIGDVVLCKVHGRFIDAHKIFKKDPVRGYLIGNNHGYENGWTHQVFAKAVSATFNGKTHLL